MADNYDRRAIYYLLRAQAKATRAYPFVVMTPKSLRRSRAAYGTIDELATGKFREVIDDARYESDKSKIERRLLCTATTTTSSRRACSTKRPQRRRSFAASFSARSRARRLSTIESYANAKGVWGLCRTKNMGARAHVRRRLVDVSRKSLKDIDYVGRPYRASLSEGYPGAHAVEQELVREALTEA